MSSSFCSVDSSLMWQSRSAYGLHDMTSITVRTAKNRPRIAVFSWQICYGKLSRLRALDTTARQDTRPKELSKRVSAVLHFRDGETIQRKVLPRRFTSAGQTATLAVYLAFLSQLLAGSILEYNIRCARSLRWRLGCHKSHGK